MALRPTCLTCGDVKKRGTCPNGCKDSALAQAILQMPIPVSPGSRRMAIERYRDGSGWFIHVPANGRTGPIQATAESPDILLAWARYWLIQAEVIT